MTGDPRTGAVLAVNAATLFIAVMTILRAPAASPGHDQTRSPPGLLSDITAGLSFARGSYEVCAVLLTVSASTLAYSGLFAVALPAFARASGHGPVSRGAPDSC